MNLGRTALWVVAIAFLLSILVLMLNPPAGIGMQAGVVLALIMLYRKV